MNMDDFENDDAFGGDGVGISFRDILVAMVAAVTALALFLLVDSVNQQKVQVGEIDEPAESLKFEVFWNYDDPASADKPYKYKLVDADVDTGVWFRGGPKMGPLHAVWFSNMGAGFINLRRDDLGNRPGIESEFDPINYELAETRGVPAGEYCVNVHLYRNSSSLKQIPVQVNVRLVRGAKRKQFDDRAPASESSDKPILTSTVVLDHVWQEINVFCFTMNEQLELVTEKTFRSDALCFHNANTTQCE